MRFFTILGPLAQYPHQIKKELLGLLVSVVSLFCLVLPLHAYANNSLDNLLQEVESFTRADRQENKVRVQTFSQSKAEQQALLNSAKQRLEQADKQQVLLKSQFDLQEDQLGELETLLKQRTGQLGEVFGVVKEQSGELKELLHQSLVNAQYPDREKALAFASSKAIPGMDKLEILWFQLQHEMTHSGKITRFDSKVAATDGQLSEQSVLRIGTFNAINQHGQFLQWNAQQQQLSVLAGQPEQKAQTDASAFYGGTGDHLLVDVSSGQLLSLIGQKPSWEQQLHKGGYVGYIILALGLLGLLTAAIKLISLSFVRFKIRKQLNNPIPDANNPLGRILLACQGRYSLEQLNNRLDEALLKELPALESGQSILKLLAATAPLLGLLGTVTGMIGTFQSITLFGTSDPKLMAGGISQALITTVFGLVVAIPMLFSHGLLSSQSRALLMILQEKSLAQLNLGNSSDADKGGDKKGSTNSSSKAANNRSHTHQDLTSKKGETAGEALV